ncbi:N-acetylmuramoyl-L-alanine amidase family protein [Fibrella arboris]|uniref:N-acetylmuramoyl-L-alanine amidase family protein n=1 Tax=Fibrella arboris TaxID=3242486 RepID=UPI003520D17C
MLVKIILLCAVLIPLLAGTMLPKPAWQDTTNQQPRPAGKANQIRTVVLDAGHGGKDPGTHGRYAKEKTTNLKLVLALGAKIREEMPDVRVIYTRNTDRFVDLYERGAIANRNRADLFISIHCNAHPTSKAVHGTETYTLGLHRTERNLDVAKRENEVIKQERDYVKTYQGFNPDSPLAYIMLANYQHAFLGSSINFAEKVEHNFRRVAERKSNGVKQAGFIVLWKTTMPSVLIEAGYLTNTDEEDFLASEEGQEQMAGAIYKAFEQFKRDMEGVN